MLKSILSRLTGSSSGASSDGASPESPGDGMPAAGNVYSFRTSPLSEFGSPESGRYAAFKVLGVNERCVSVAIMDGIWTASPSLSAIDKAAVLHEHRFGHIGRMATFGVNANWWTLSDLDSVSFLGQRSLSPEEKVTGEKIIALEIGCRYSTLRYANNAAEGEWRWKHDRDAFVAEFEREKAKAAAERAAKEERYQTRLKNLTWEKLLAETPFERWSSSPPFPPKQFTEGARVTIHRACRELRDLGPKPPKAEVRLILRRCVSWFNEADEIAGQVIETEEREDICAILEEMAFVAKQKGLVNEINNWREWSAQ